MFVGFVCGGDFGEGFGAPHYGDEGALVHGCCDVVEFGVDFCGFFVCDGGEGYHGAPDHAVILAMQQPKKVWCVVCYEVGF